MSGPPGAVLWDFDGTLVDSETVWVEVERGMAQELGGELPDDYFELTLGGTIDHTAAYIIDTVGSDASVEEVAASLWARAGAALASGPIRWLPGVRELVDALAAVGVPQGLVSSGHREYLEVTLSRLAPSPFACVVAGDEVAHNKPHPDPYLRAIDAIGVPAVNCLVIEDSPTGVAAGVAAGCAVLAVSGGSTFEPKSRLTVIDTLAGMTLERLHALVGDLR
jgi:HAD superfamily hydrolase (TIGR01509 family)